MARRAARTDANHQLIADAFSMAGCSVQSLAAVGCGCPDLLVAVNGHTFTVEVKDGSKPPSERALTPRQKTWHRKWRGTTHVITTVDEAVMVAEQWRKRRFA